jgi:hypothetical protein
MTAARRTRKRYVWLAALALAFPVVGSALQAATTERVVVDRYTGLAIYGIDPVAYFTSGKPTAGRENFELRHAGAVWRFDNEGNRAAFAADPQVYMPQFGGYDPVGVSLGLARPGTPALWVVSEQRLYLFYTTDARATFLANPAEVVAAASARWSALRSELAE